MIVLRPLLLSLLVGAAALPAKAQSPFSSAENPSRTITVRGEGEASARPDLAATTFTVLRLDETARGALDTANAAMTQIIAAMKAEGIEDRDIQTTGFSVNPQYRYEQRADGTQAPPEIVGYEVRNTLTLRLRDVARLGAILDRAVALGVNEGGDIRFDFADPQALLAEARRDAVADATATARLLAEAAGIEIGQVLEITTEVEPAPPQPYAMARNAVADAGASVPVETGENTVSAAVRMVFEVAQ